MTYMIVDGGRSRSFTRDAPFIRSATADADIVVYLAGSTMQPDPSKKAILVELNLECLGVHTGEDSGEEGSNILGFARYRNGDDEPSSLVEIVRQPKTEPEAIAAAANLFEAAGLQVVICGDHAGRIIDRLVRPKYNAALRFLDEGLATASGMDLTCRLGLGYPDGPIERVTRGGLVRHYEISRMLFDFTGQPGYVPARRAAVAHARAASVPGQKEPEADGTGS